MSRRAGLILVALVAACGSKKEPPRKKPCSVKLAYLTQRISTIADEMSVSPLHALEEQTGKELHTMRTDLFSLVGAPGDLSRFDYLILGDGGARMLTASGISRTLVYNPATKDLGELPPATSPQLVIGILPTVRWTVVRHVLEHAYAANRDVLLAFHTDGAIRIDSPPKELGSFDKILPVITEDLAKTCPKVLADYQGDRTDTVAFMRELITDIPGCTCEVDATKVQWLVNATRTPLVTLVPVTYADSGKPMPIATDNGMETWGDVAFELAAMFRAGPMKLH